MKAKASLLKQEAEVEVTSKEVKDFLDVIVPKSVREAGGILYDKVKLWRFKNQVEILEKASKYANERGLDISQVNLKVLVPLLENASLEEEDNLQDKWAAMLTNAATGAVIIRPLFPEILKELSSKEVQILDAMFSNFVAQNNPDLQFDKKQIGQTFLIAGTELELAVDNFMRLGICRTPGNKGISFGDFPVAMHTTDIFEFTALGRQFVAACKPPNIK